METKLWGTAADLRQTFQVIASTGTETLTQSSNAEEEEVKKYFKKIL